jgi:uncharacterized protein (DUF2126 family)/transglutaminase-like putative cysteine protease
VTTRVGITHRIEQRFERPLLLSTHWLRLRPAPQTRAHVSAYSLAVRTQPHFLNWVRDPFENYLARLDLPEPVSGLDIELELIAELEPINPFDFLSEPYAAEHPFAYPAQLQKELIPYLQPIDPGPRLRAWLAELERTPSATSERLDRVNQAIHETFALRVTSALGPVDPELVLARRMGTCWDLAWLLTLSLRHLGLAARFACGYRVLLDDTASGLDGVSMHAWAEAFVPGAGWIGLDPAAGLFTTETYLPLAAAPDPLRTLPMVGTRAAGAGTSVERLQVRRLVPAPDAWPYSATQWADIQALGGYVDRDLARQELKPAMGVSLSLISGIHALEPEWNTTALGASKRSAGEALLADLQERIAPGALRQLGQGEWFGGDALPRWRLGCYFRADGQPAWRNPDLQGWGRTREFLPDDASRFANALARALGIDPGYVIAAHEDALHELGRSRSRAAAAPSAAELRDPLQRRALAERLSRGHREPTGYVLPIRWDHAAARWSSGLWMFRRDRLYLMPGASPLGYRLPLEGLKQDAESLFEAQLERCQFEELPALGDFHAVASARLRASGVSEAAPALRSSTRRLAPRTALCVEIRAGQLFVFLPPLAYCEHYLQLVAAIEAAAEATQLPVILEGYEPPEDCRLRRLVLEPDAGVLRLALPLAQSWREQAGLLRAAYETARELGFRTERLMLDGRRLPSGGGSTLTLGGPRPVESPFLTRPEILRAVIAYWQRHPCLSYLFAGKIIGGGAAAPRADEGRDEALYELSIALERLGLNHDDAPWHADRVLRHLLTDPAGNLKRAEIRVDQLYSPDRASLRLGRILISSFETAPEERIAALQSLLVLGLLGYFGRRGDSGALTRWGSALHDQFMLPHVLWTDLGAVIEDLNSAGYPFQLEWFEPLMTLRFPVLGAVQLGEITLELRTAHEPWPLLGEEVSGGGVARFIDTANERLQVKISGMSPSRYLLICNDEDVPLRGTGIHGQYVAGVRYKVWSPAATLHPTLPPVAALVFDVLDSWTGRVIGGCTYIPGQYQSWGPSGSVEVAPPAPTEGPISREPPPPLPPVTYALPPTLGHGRFFPYGSGLPTLSPPPRHRDIEYLHLLDLTQRA